MKRFLLCAFALLLLLLCACQRGDAPLLTVRCGDSTITPYALKRSYRSWDEEHGQWISGSFAPMNVTTCRSEFSTLVFTDSLSFDCGKNISVQSITLYDTRGSEIAVINNVADLEPFHAQVDALPSGMHYVVIRVVQQGDYREQGKGYEENGYDLGFSLAINAVPNDAPLCQITCGDSTITPYDHHLNSFGGSVFADSPSLRATLQKGEELPLPALTWTETAVLSLNPNVQKREVDVYDVRNYRHLHDFSDISELDTLPAGEYLVTVNLVLYHEYLPNIDKFTYTGYEMGFRLIKP